MRPPRAASLAADILVGATLVLIFAGGHGREVLEWGAGVMRQVQDLAPVLIRGVPSKVNSVPF